MKWTIIAFSIISMLLFTGFLHAGVNKPSFDDKIKTMTLSELEKQMTISNIKLIGSVAGSFTGPIIIIGSGYVSYKTGTALFEVFTGNLQIDDPISLGLFILSGPVFIVSTAIMLGGIALTEGSIRGIIEQNKHINAIQVEMVRFKPLTYNDKPSIGIGISIAL